MVYVQQLKQNRVRATLDEFRKTFLPGHNADEEEGGDAGEEGSLGFILQFNNPLERAH